MFIYSVLGVFLFGKFVKGNIVDEYVNFSNFHQSLLLLFRCSTGEDWWVIMYDVAGIRECPSDAIICNKGNHLFQLI